VVGTAPTRSPVAGLNDSSWDVIVDAVIA